MTATHTLETVKSFESKPCTHHPISCNNGTWYIQKIPMNTKTVKNQTVVSYRTVVVNKVVS